MKFSTRAGIVPKKKKKRMKRAHFRSATVAMQLACCICLLFLLKQVNYFIQLSLHAFRDAKNHDATVAPLVFDGWDDDGPCASASSLSRFLASSPQGRFSKYNPVCPTAIYSNIHVIIPFYNLNERTIAKIIQSARDQIYPSSRVSVWVFDDGSKRGGAEEILNKVCDVGGVGSNHVFEFSPPARNLGDQHDSLYATKFVNTSGLNQIEQWQNRRVFCFRSTRRLGQTGAKYWLFRLIHAIAQPNDVVVVLDGGDKFSYRKALRTVNQKYIDTSAWFTYGSNEGTGQVCNEAMLQPELPSKASDRIDISVDVEPSIYSCPHTFKAHLLDHMVSADFLNEDGRWLVNDTNHRYVYRMLELSGEDRVGFIPIKIFENKRHNSTLAATTLVENTQFLERLDPSSRLELPIHVVLLCWKRLYLLPHQFVWLQQQEELNGRQIHLHLVNNNWEQRETIDQAVANFTRGGKKSLSGNGVTAPIAITVVHNHQHQSKDIFARYSYVHQLRQTRPMDEVIFVDDDQYWTPTFISSLLRDHKPKGMTTWYGKIFRHSEDPKAMTTYWNSSIRYWDIALGRLWPEESTFKSAGPGGSILDTNLWLFGGHFMRFTDEIYSYSRIDDLWVSYVLDALLGWEIRRLTPPTFAVDIGFLPTMKGKPNVKERLESLINKEDMQQVDEIIVSHAHKVLQVGTFDDPTVDKQTVFAELQSSFRWDIFKKSSISNLESSTPSQSVFDCAQVNIITVVRELGAGADKRVYEVVLPNGVRAAAKRCDTINCLRRNEIQEEARYFRNLQSQFGEEAVQFYGECSFPFGPGGKDVRKRSLDFMYGPTLFMELAKPLMSHWSKKKEAVIPKSDTELEDLRTIARQYDAYIEGPIRLEGDNGDAHQYVDTMAGIRHIDFGAARLMPSNVTSVLSHNCDVLMGRLALLDPSDERWNCTEAYSRERETQAHEKETPSPIFAEALPPSGCVLTQDEVENDLRWSQTLEFWRNVSKMEAEMFPNRSSLSGRGRKEIFTKYMGLSKKFYRDKVVMDIGSGPRSTLEWLKDPNVNGSAAIGVDPLAEFFRKEGFLNGHKVMSTVAGCAEAIPVENGTVDIAISTNSIGYWTDLSKGLKSIHRVLAPGGWLLVATDVTTTNVNNKLERQGPLKLGWDLVDQVEEAGFKLVFQRRLVRYEKGGIYGSIKLNTTFEHGDRIPGSLGGLGVLMAGFRKARAFKRYLSSASEGTPFEGRLPPHPLLDVPFYIYEDLIWLEDETIEREVPLHDAIKRLGYKHSDDYWFLIASLQHPMRTRDPEKAKLFVVPTLLNEVITQHLCLNGMCDLDLRNDTDNTSNGSAWRVTESYLGPKGVCHRGVCGLDLLKLTNKALGESPWFQRHGGKDHIIVASHSASGWYARFDNIARCNVIAHEWRNWNHPSRAALPKLPVGRACYEAKKEFDFAMVASMKERDSHQARRDICNWLGQNRSMYSMPVCGEGHQCPTLAQARFGFHVRGDTFGSNRLIDALLSGTVPIFTQKEQYEVLPDWIDWEKISYFADVTDREEFLNQIDKIYADRKGYEEKLKTLLANKDLFDWRTLTPFDTFMHMMLSNIMPDHHGTITNPYSALILERPGGSRVFGERGVICDAQQTRADSCGMCPRGRGVEGCRRDCHWCKLGPEGVGMSAQSIFPILNESDMCVHVTQKCKSRKSPTPISGESASTSHNPVLQLGEDDVHLEQRTALETVQPIIHPAYPRALQPNTFEMTEMTLIPEIRMRRLIYFITPTHKRETQMVDLIRLKQTLMLASLQKHHSIYWIVIEDSESCTKRVRDVLNSSGLRFAHAAVHTSREDAKVIIKDGVEVVIHRGVDQRHKGLDIAKEVGAEGVVYFGDDDNAYDAQLFSELPFTRKVSVFGVAFVGKSPYARCQVSNDTGLVVDIHSGWRGAKGLPERKYPMDMAGFAFSTSVLIGKNPRFNTDLPSGYLESGFIDDIVSGMGELEPLAGNCTKILAWHVKTSARAVSNQITTESQQDLQRISSLV